MRNRNVENQLPNYICIYCTLWETNVSNYIQSLSEFHFLRLTLLSMKVSTVHTQFVSNSTMVNPAFPNHTYTCTA